jgi:tetratricopeptide (TPR) repeat protein
MDERRPDDWDASPGPTAGSDPAADADDHESAYALLQRGEDLLLQRHFAQAATVLERADRAEPGKASILEALGRAYYNSGQHERSRATFEALLQLDPSGPYAHFALGQSLKQLGRPDEARTHLKLAVALSPESTIYAGALARLGPGPKRTPQPRTPPD